MGTREEFLREELQRIKAKVAQAPPFEQRLPQYAAVARAMGVSVAAAARMMRVDEEEGRREWASARRAAEDSFV